MGKYIKKKELRMRTKVYKKRLTSKCQSFFIGFLQYVMKLFQIRKYAISLFIKCFFGVGKMKFCDIS